MERPRGTADIVVRAVPQIGLPGGWLRITLVEFLLVPVGIDGSFVTNGVQAGDFFRRQFPAQRAKVLQKLLLVPSPDDDVRNGGAAKYPVQCDLRNGLAALLGNLLEHIYDREELFFIDGRATLGAAGCDTPFARRLSTANLSGKPSPSQWAPHHSAQSLIKCQRHKLPFIMPTYKGIASLVDHVSSQTILLRRGQRPHDLPTGKVRGTDIRNLAAREQVVERPQCLIHWGQGIETMHEVDIYVISLKAFQASFACAYQMVPRRTHLIGVSAHWESTLGGDQCAIALPF